MLERRGAPTRLRVTTSRRLAIALSAVLVSFLAALVFQIAGLRRMETTLDAMSAHEEQMRLALQLEDAVRDQYLHAGRMAMGDRQGLADYEQERARALALHRMLVEVVDEPDARPWLEEIRDASAELDRMFRERIAPPHRSGDRGAALAHEESYPLVSRIERNVDLTIGRLQQAATEFRRELVAAQAAAARATTMLLVASPLLVGAAVFYLRRSVARPLARLSEGAAALAAGNLETRIDITTPDEFGALAADFNAMTVALKEHQARLVDSEKLAGIGRLAAGLSHELNNPLQVILGYVSLHRDVDERLARQLGIVEREVLACREVVDGLLELSRPPVSSSPVDLRELSESIADTLRIATPPPFPRLSVDGAAVALGSGPKLRQAVFNLVKNALEAAGPEGEVHVQIGAAGEMAEVAVRDSGPGVSEDARRRLFEPFFSTRAGGKGLGLPVSRAIALEHGGDIEFVNGGSRGAVFTLRVPRFSQEGGDV